MSVRTCLVIVVLQLHQCVHIYFKGVQQVECSDEDVNQFNGDTLRFTLYVVAVGFIVTIFFEGFTKFRMDKREAFSEVTAIIPPSLFNS